jgi:hypothetical protein
MLLIVDFELRRVMIKIEQNNENLLAVWQIMVAYFLFVVREHSHLLSTD